MNPWENNEPEYYDARRVLLVDADPQASLTLATVGDCEGRSLAQFVYLQSL